MMAEHPPIMDAFLPLKPCPQYPCSALLTINLYEVLRVFMLSNFVDNNNGDSLETGIPGWLDMCFAHRGGRRYYDAGRKVRYP